MIVLLALVLLVLAFLLRRRRPRLSIGITSTTLLSLSAFASGPLTQVMLDDLQADFTKGGRPSWRQSSVIVLLGLGTDTIGSDQQVEPISFAYGRILKAYLLYRDCKSDSERSCTLLVSGGDNQSRGISEAAVYARVLRELGADEKDVIEERQSRNTWENAKYSRAILEQKGGDYVVIVTSGIHLRRSLLYFAHFGIVADGFRGDALNTIPSPAALSFNLTLAELAVHEYLGLQRYRFYNAMNWNPPPLPTLVTP